MLSRNQLQLLERLRDDCDVLISMLIREGEVPTVPARSLGRVVRLLRQPRLLFDLADGWPPLEEVAEATGLTWDIVEKLASELDNLSASVSNHFPIVRTRAKKQIDVGQAIALLQYGCAEVALWRLRQWLERRLTTVGATPANNISVLTAPTVLRTAKLPPLRRFDDGPSLGFQPDRHTRASLIEMTLLERANQAHEATLQAVRHYLAARGVECLKSALIDLACVLDSVPQIIEAKSISPDNEVEQVRAAYAQLHDYRFRYRSEEPFAGREIGLWVVLSEVPCEDWTVGFLRDAGIRLVWLGESGGLAGPDFPILRP